MSIVGAALVVDYDPAYEYALNSGNLSALGNNASAATTYDLTTADASQQPPYNAIDATANNKPTIGNFDGSVDNLRNTTANPHSGLAKCSTFLAARYSNTSSNQLLISGTTGIMSQQVASGNVFVYAAAGIYGSCIFTSTNWNVFELVFDGSLSGNANRLKLFINGTQQTLSFVGTVPAVLPTVTAFYMGTLGFTPSVSFSGKIAQYVVTSQADTVDLNPRMRRLLGSKFGIAVV